MEIDDSMDAKVKPECGEQLQTARKAHQLSLEDVAKKLNLPVARIKEIEESHFDESVSIAFYRGYIRSYASLLNLDPKLIVESFNQSVDTDVEIASPQRLRSFSAGRKEVTTGSQLFKWVSVILVVALIFLVGWGLKNKLGSPSENNNSDFTSVESVFGSDDNIGDSADDQKIDPKAVEEIPESSRSQGVTVEQIKQRRSDLIAAQDNVEPNEQAAPDSVSENANVNASEPAFGSTSQPETEGGTDTTKDELVFAFVGECWVQISDATGEVLAVGVKNTGKVMPLSGVPPFKVVLGDPSVVRLQHKQKTIDLSGYQAGQVARFTIE